MVTNGAVFSSRKEMFLKSKKIFVGRGITATVSLMIELWRVIGSNFNLPPALQRQVEEAPSHCLDFPGCSQC